MKEKVAISKGDELLWKRRLFLYYLCDWGAIAHNSAIHATDLQDAIQVNESDFESLYRNLSDAGLVEARRNWARSVGGGRSSWFELWLTPAGLEDALAISEAARNSIERCLKGPIGFIPHNGNG